MSRKSLALLSAASVLSLTVAARAADPELTVLVGGVVVLLTQQVDLFGCDDFDVVVGFDLEGHFSNNYTKDQDVKKTENA